MAGLVVAAAGLAFLTWRHDSAELAASAAAVGEGAAAREERTRRRLPEVDEAETPSAAPAQPERPIPATPSHAAGPKCENCSAQNCVASTDGCDRLKDPERRKLCEDLYACFSDPAHDCVNQGDPVKCWCGTHPTTCLTDKSGPNRANGPCADKVFAAAGTDDPMTIKARFVDPDYALGGAVNLTLCRGSWCSSECRVQ